MLKDELVDSVFISLGRGVIDVELTDEQVEEMMNQALIMYSRFVPHTKRLIKSVGASQQIVDITDDLGEDMKRASIMDVQPEPSAAIASANVYEDIFSYPAASIPADKLSVADYVQDVYDLQVKKSFLSSDFDYEVLRDEDAKTIKIAITPLTTAMNIAIEYAVPYRNVETIPHKDLDWVTQYTLAKCKVLLGMIRSKFGSYPAQQGSIDLGGESMRSEGKDDVEKLEDDLKNRSRSFLISSG